MLKRVVLAGLLAISACASAPEPLRAPEPARAVDSVQFYSGTWREIGRRPMSMTDGCVAGATSYHLRSDGRVDVRDTCQVGSPTGRERAIAGTGRIADSSRNAKLEVTYRFWGVWPVRWDYWILDHDDAYTWFISADPQLKNLWIYTRDPRPSPALVAQLRARARALGYDDTQLEFPAQP